MHAHPCVWYQSTRKWCGKTLTSTLVRKTPTSEQAGRRSRSKGGSDLKSSSSTFSKINKQDMLMNSKLTRSSNPFEFSIYLFSFGFYSRLKISSTSTLVRRKKGVGRSLAAEEKKPPIPLQRHTRSVDRRLKESSEISLPS